MANVTAYKVENGVIINATVVDDTQPLEEGLVIRDYGLGIGFVESHGDFYPSDVTSEDIERNRNNNIRRTNLTIDITNENIQNLENYIDTLTSQLESLPTDDEGRVELQEKIEMSQNRLQKLNDYIVYLDNHKNNLRNPIFQVIKPIEEL
jgi:hypothetical protein